MDDSFRVIAIISAFNEGDIISPVIGHLVENGADVYLIDNHSTDDTVEQAHQWLGRGLLDIESFPKSLPAGCESPGPFDWSAILHRKEELAGELSANWFIHHDADEVRESPWPGITLKESIHWVDKLGYNCIDFRLLNFPPIDDGFKQGDDPRTYFKFYEEGAECDKVQLKCWKAGNTPVSLAPHGGHEARFPGRRVFPVQFLLRHYPIRGQKHGVRKVFAERRERILQAEKLQGWHRQYDQIVNKKHVFIRDAAELRSFDLDQARLESMLPDNLIKHTGNLEKQRDELKSHARNLELAREELQKHAENLEKERDELRQHATNLEAERSEFRVHATNLETERDGLKSHTGNLEQEREELRRHIANLEQVRNQIRQQLANLEEEHEVLKRHAAGLEHESKQMRARLESSENLRRDLEREMSELRNSRSWRWTAPLRWLFDMLKL